MANDFTSTAAAFQQLGPGDDSFAGAVTQGFQVGRQIKKDRQAEEAAKAAVRQRRSAAAAKSAKELGLSDITDVKSIGAQTLDNINIGAVNMIADERLKMSQLLRDNPGLARDHPCIGKSPPLETSGRRHAEAQERY